MRNGAERLSNLDILSLIGVDLYEFEEKVE
jgi:hypothetical protein